MSSTASGTGFVASDASAAAHLATAVCRDHCNTVPFTEQETKRDDRTDSKAEPGLPTEAVSQTKNKTLLCSCNYISCLQAAQWEFDLRTKDGLATLAACRKDLGSHAWCVRSLTIKHWTTWWSFRDNHFKSSKDETHFSRDESGNLLVSRALPTSPRETCQCSVAQQITQLYPMFNLERCHAIAKVSQSATYLRASDEELANRLTLVDAAKKFAELLQDRSKQLDRDFKRQGSQCVTCDMPMLYLCGHLVTQETKDGTGKVGAGEMVSQRSDRKVTWSQQTIDGHVFTRLYISSQ